MRTLIAEDDNRIAAFVAKGLRDNADDSTCELAIWARNLRMEKNL